MALPGHRIGDCVIKVGEKEPQGGRAGVILGVPFSCGDGLVNTVDEYCDDGNTENGDGCDSNCFPESGYYCPTSPLKSPGRCIHIADCPLPLPDRCECDLEKGFCDSMFISHKMLDPLTD